MPKIRAYHLGRQRIEEAMAVNADSPVARISHSKLAALHRDRAAGSEPATPTTPIRDARASIR